ncbi:MAG: glycosyltransferase family 2 protein [Candidatus Omnitrophota bacterium]|nr:glycosyltransferase family 2 protein [Candidatus Omnitrophota bacterium]
MSENNNVDVSIIVACYNDAPHLKNNVGQIMDIMDTTRYSYEIIFVDDKSRDNSRDMIDQIIAEHPGRRLSKKFHEQNMGRGRSVTDGFIAAKGRIMGYLDIDLEIHARYIPSVLLEIEKGADFVIARRLFDLNYHSIVRFIVSKGYIRFSGMVLGMKGIDSESGFKFFNRKTMMGVINSVKDGHWFWDTEVVCRSRLADKKIIEVPALFVKLPHKPSTVRFSKDIADYVIKIFKFRRELREDICKTKGR